MKVVEAEALSGRGRADRKVKGSSAPETGNVVGLTKFWQPSLTRKDSGPGAPSTGEKQIEVIRVSGFASRNALAGQTRAATARVYLQRLSRSGERTKTPTSAFPSPSVLSTVSLWASSMRMRGCLIR